MANKVIGTGEIEIIFQYEKNLKKVLDSIKQEWKKVDVDKTLGKVEDAIKKLNKAVSDEIKVEKQANETKKQTKDLNEKIANNYLLLDKAMKSANTEQTKYISSLKQQLSEGKKLEQWQKERIKLLGEEEKGVKASTVGIGFMSYELERMGQAMFEVVKQSTLFSAKIEKNLAVAGAVAGATREQVAQMESTMVNTGRVVPISYEKITQSMYDLASAGLNATEVMQALPQASKLSAGVGEDLNQSIELLISTVKAFDMEFSDSNKILDVFANATAKSMGTVEKFQVAFSRVAPMAQQANVSFEETTAVLSKLFDLGLRGSNAGTVLGNVMTRLGSFTDKAKESLKQAGLTTKDVSLEFNTLGESLSKIAMKMQEGKVNGDQLQQIFGTRGKIITDLLNQLKGDTVEEKIKSYDKLVSSMSDATDAVDRFFGVQKETTQMTLDKYNNSIENLKLLTGGAIKDSLVPFANIITDINNKIYDTVKGNKELEKTWGIVAGTLAVGGKLISGLGALSGIFMSLSAIKYLDMASKMSAFVGVFSMANPILLTTVTVLGALTAGFIAYSTARNKKHQEEQNFNDGLAELRDLMKENNGVLSDNITLTDKQREAKSKLEEYYGTEITNLGQLAKATAEYTKQQEILQKTQEASMEWAKVNRASEALKTLGGDLYGVYGIGGSTNVALSEAFDKQMQSALAGLGIDYSKYQGQIKNNGLEKGLPILEKLLRENMKVPKNKVEILQGQVAKLKSGKVDVDTFSSSKTKTGGGGGSESDKTPADPASIASSIMNAYFEKMKQDYLKKAETEISSQSKGKNEQEIKELSAKVYNKANFDYKMAVEKLLSTTESGNLSETMVKNTKVDFKGADVSKTKDELSKLLRDKDSSAFSDYLFNVTKLFQQITNNSQSLNEDMKSKIDAYDSMYTIAKDTGGKDSEALKKAFIDTFGEQSNLYDIFIEEIKKGSSVEESVYNLSEQWRIELDNSNKDWQAKVSEDLKTKMDALKSMKDSMNPDEYESASQRLYLEFTKIYGDIESNTKRGIELSVENRGRFNAILKSKFDDYKNNINNIYSNVTDSLDFLNNNITKFAVNKDASTPVLKNTLENLGIAKEEIGNLILDFVNPDKAKSALSKVKELIKASMGEGGELSSKINKAKEDLNSWAEKSLKFGAISKEDFDKFKIAIDNNQFDLVVELFNKLNGKTEQLKTSLEKFTDGLDSLSSAFNQIGGLVGGSFGQGLTNLGGILSQVSSIAKLRDTALNSEAWGKLGNFEKAGNILGQVGGYMAIAGMADSILGTNIMGGQSAKSDAHDKEVEQKWNDELAKLDEINKTLEGRLSSILDYTIKIATANAPTSSNIASGQARMDAVMKLVGSQARTFSDVVYKTKWDRDMGWFQGKRTEYDNGSMSIEKLFSAMGFKGNLQTAGLGDLGSFADKLKQINLNDIISGKGSELFDKDLMSILFPTTGGFINDLAGKIFGGSRDYLGISETNLAQISDQIKKYIETVKIATERAKEFARIATLSDFEGITYTDPEKLLQEYVKQYESMGIVVTDAIKEQLGKQAKENSIGETISAQVRSGLVDGLANGNMNLATAIAPMFSGIFKNISKTLYDTMFDTLNSKISTFYKSFAEKLEAVKSAGGDIKKFAETYNFSDILKTIKEAQDVQISMETAYENLRKQAKEQGLSDKDIELLTNDTYRIELRSSISDSIKSGIMEGFNDGEITEESIKNSIFGNVVDRAMAGIIAKATDSKGVQDAMTALMNAVKNGDIKNIEELGGLLEDNITNELSNSNEEIKILMDLMNKLKNNSKSPIIFFDENNVKFLENNLKDLENFTIETKGINSTATSVRKIEISITTDGSLSKDEVEAIAEKVANEAKVEVSIGRII